MASGGFCPNCGAARSGAGRFCGSCGQPFDVPKAASPEAAATHEPRLDPEPTLHGAEDVSPAGDPGHAEDLPDTDTAASPPASGSDVAGRIWSRRTIGFVAGGTAVVLIGGVAGALALSGALPWSSDGSGDGGGPGWAEYFYPAQVGYSCTTEFVFDDFEDIVTTTTTTETVTSVTEVADGTEIGINRTTHTETISDDPALGVPPETLETDVTYRVGDDGSLRVPPLTQSSGSMTVRTDDFLLYPPVDDLPGDVQESTVVIEMVPADESGELALAEIVQPGDTSLRMEVVFEVEGVPARTISTPAGDFADVVGVGWTATDADFLNLASEQSAEFDAVREQFRQLLSTLFSLTQWYARDVGPVASESETLIGPVELKLTECTGGPAAAGAGPPSTPAGDASPSTPDGTTTAPEPSAGPSTEPGDSAITEWPRELVLTLTPSADPQEVLEAAEPLAAMLEARLEGVDITPFVPLEDASVVDAFEFGQVHIGGGLGPRQVVQAEEHAGAEPILQSVRFEEAFYVTQWFTNDPDTYCADEPVDVDGDLFCNGVDQASWATDGPIGADMLANVAGETAAFIEESSTSGYGVPALQLLDAGIDPVDDIARVFAGGHDTSVLTVYHGDADVGVSFDGARSLVVDEFPDVGEKVVVFGWSHPIPNEGFVVAGDLPNDLKQAITEAFLDIASAEEGNGLLDDLYNGIDSVVPVDSGAYDVIRRMESAGVMSGS